MSTWKIDPAYGDLLEVVKDEEGVTVPERRLERVADRATSFLLDPEAGRDRRGHKIRVADGSEADEPCTTG